MNISASEGDIPPEAQRGQSPDLYILCFSIKINDFDLFDFAANWDHDPLHLRDMIEQSGKPRPPK